MSSAKSWKKPSIDGFKMNFDEATKGNTCPASFGGAIREPQGKILSFYWGSLGSCSNNIVEPEGLLNRVAWVIQNQ